MLQKDQGFSVELLQNEIVRDVQSTLWVLLGAVSFVLLIACANVANLLLVRATGRRREIAIRAAIGAGRGRIIRQLLTESVLLSLAGGIIGLVLGMIGIRALLALNTAGLPRMGEDGSVVTLDWRVLAFTLAVSIGTGVLFGLIPALQASRADLSGTLKESSSRAGTGFRQNKARSMLVVTEVALALILLVGSALLVRTAVALRAVNPGFDPGHVLTMRMSMTGERFMKSDGVEQAVRLGVEKMRAIPGVEIASATCCVPLEGGYGLPFVIVGRPLTDGPFHGGGGWKTVSPGYFEVFKIAAKRGRTFTDRDTKRLAARGDHQRGDGEAVLAEGRSALRSPHHRPRRDEGVCRRARAADHRRHRGHARRLAQRRSRARDVHPAGAGARSGQRAERAHHADRVGRAHGRSTRSRSTGRSRKRCVRRRACRSRTCGRWTRSSSGRCRGSASTCG